MNRRHRQHAPHVMDMRMTIAALMCLLALLSNNKQGNAAEPIPAYIQSAVAAADRPAEDRARDALRLPAQVLAFAGVKPGDKVADLMPGRGYFTKLFCRIVGERGFVYAVNVPRPAVNTPPRGLDVLAPNCSNVAVINLEARKVPAPETYNPSADPGGVYEYWSVRVPAENFAVPEKLDLIWTSENYHDLHNEAFSSPRMMLVAQAMYDALRPGGVLMVEDHAAQPGSGARDTDTLHRIDPDLVRQELTAAGFEYVGQSTVLQSRDDAHNTKAHDMHDRTDRFLLKFRRPR